MCVDVISIAISERLYDFNATSLPLARVDPENNVRGGPDVGVFFLPSCFTECRTNLPREASPGVSTAISKQSNSLFHTLYKPDKDLDSIFQGWGLEAPSHPGSA